jgi:hypothetical protein
VHIYYEKENKRDKKVANTIDHPKILPLKIASLFSSEKRILLAITSDS